MNDTLPLITDYSRKARIVLVRPRGYDDGKASLPFGIISIARYLESHEIPAVVIDGYHPENSQETILERIGACCPEYVGISAMSVQVPQARELIAGIRKRFPSTRIIVGGVHFTARPEDGADLGQVVRGAGEKAVFKIITGEIPENQSITQDEYLDELSFNPFPNRADLIRLNIQKNTGDFSIMTSRGCPFSCTYCLNRSQRDPKILEYPLDYVVRLIRDAHEGLGFNRFFISDDVFFLKQKRVEEFCSLIDAIGCRLKFRAFSHPSIKNRTMFTRAQTSGFHNIALGVESGNERILKLINKNTKPDQIEDTVKELISCGLKISCLYMLGNIGESVGTMEDTIAFSRRLHNRYGCSSWFSIAQPFPGTAFRDEVERYGCLLHEQFEHYDNHHVSFLPHGVTEKDLFRLWNKGMIFGNRPALAAYLRYAFFLLTGR